MERNVYIVWNINKNVETIQKDRETIIRENG